MYPLYPTTTTIVGGTAITVDERGVTVTQGYQLIDWPPVVYATGTNGKPDDPDGVLARVSPRD